MPRKAINMTLAELGADLDDMPLREEAPKAEEEFIPQGELEIEKGKCISRAEAADLLNVSLSFFKEMLGRGIFKGVRYWRIGRKFWYYRPDIEARWRELCRR